MAAEASGTAVRAAHLEVATVCNEIQERGLTIGDLSRMAERDPEANALYARYRIAVDRRRELEAAAEGC